MANQAFSLADDLLVGAGEVWFKRLDDPNGWHHLGNVDEMSITVDVTKVEKNSSMNKKRTLMSSVVTAVKASSKLTMTEYNPYNLALGLYGTEAVSQQSAKTIVDEQYVVTGIPSIVTLVDKNNNRYYNVSEVIVRPQNAVPAKASWVTIPTTLGTFTDTTFTDVLGGTIKIEAGTFTGTEDERIFFNVKSAPVAAGDVEGLVIEVKEGVIGVVQEFTATPGTSYTFNTAGGVKFTVTLGATENLTVFPTGVLGEAKVIPSTTAYVKERDYTYSDQDLRAGIIRIKDTGAIQSGDIVKISYKVPEQAFITASLGDAGDIEGEFMYNGDNNSGTNYVIEAFRVKISPEGDIGFLGSDFSTFSLTVDILDDSQNHADYPLAKVTAVQRTGGGNTAKGEYDPKW